MHHAQWWLHTMDTHVGLQITLGSEGSSTDFALKWSFTSMDPVVHLKSTLAAEDTMTNHTLIGVRYLVFQVVHELLKLGSFRSVDFHVLLETFVMVNHLGWQDGITSTWWTKRNSGHQWWRRWRWWQRMMQ